MKTKHTDVVAEYLHEVDQRLAGMPVLQRRELLADLAAHIASERAERNLATEGELIEVLERLGSPDVVAAAAHEEAGTRPETPKRRRPAWVWPVVAGVSGLFLLVVLGLCAFSFFWSSSSSRPEPAAPAPAVSPR
ncbi:HAAS signaling domain-containing protein [Actinoplanes sp. CA-030573]|uniref:HAAS signaling domain-containing protein n=1 Tax=Actinoplanes sp. CA-030573 TaxID=3239898 RepID=UPI003D90364E